MVSKMVGELVARMDGMSEAEFADMLGLSKAEMVTHLEEMAQIEAASTARVGAIAPDFTAHPLGDDGTVSQTGLTLSEMPAQPTALIFGCYTCPVFRRQTGQMNDIVARFEHAVRFLFVYVTEAHPTDGWNTPSNRAADIMVAQPSDLVERARVAASWRAAFGIKAPVLLDWPDDRINAAYSGSPERLYVLDAARTVTFRSQQGPYHDAHLDDWEAALADVAGTPRAG